MMADNTQGFTNAQKQSERDVIEGNAGPGIGNREPGTADTGNASSNVNPQDVKQQAREMANQTKEQGKTMLEQKKGAAAGQMDSVAHAFRTTAEHLQGEGQQKTGDYVGMIADQLENAARQLKQKNLNELLHDAQDLARRSPATFIAGSVAVGFLLARFLKSSSEPGGEYREEYRGAGRSRGRSQYGAENMDSEDSTGLETGFDETHRTGSGAYSGMSDSRMSGADYDSAAPDTDRDGARFSSASASPLAGTAATGSPPVGTNAAGIAGAPGSAINPSTLGGNSYGNRQER